MDLLTILRVLNQINQEQAWAICYQAVATIQRLGPEKCAPIDSLAQIYLNKDGRVHEKTFTQPIKTSTTSKTTSTTEAATTTTHPTTTIATTTQTPASASTISSPSSSASSSTTSTPTSSTPATSPTTSTATPTSTALTPTTTPTTTTTTTPTTTTTTPELNEVLRWRLALNECELVASLGIALFWALDYGIPDDEERKLSIAMEYLIYQSQSKLSLDEVAEICINRLPIATRAHADSHYKGVCKSLVSDTIELSIFLEKIYTASMVLSDITLDQCHRSYKGVNCDIGCPDHDDALNAQLGEPLASLRALRFNDWARLWMQVIRELRQRGKFKQAMAVN